MNRRSVSFAAVALLSAFAAAVPLLSANGGEEYPELPALALSGFGEEQMFDVKPGHSPGAWRMRWNVGGPMDLSESDGIEFDFFCDNTERFGVFILRVRTGDDPRPVALNGYSFRFQPYKKGSWHRVRLYKAYVDSYHPPCGSWAGVKGMELVGQEGDGSGAARVGIANIRPIPCERPAAIVLLGEHGLPRDARAATGQPKAWCLQMMKSQQEALKAIGLSNFAMSDIDLAAKGVPDGVRLVSASIIDSLPDGAFAALTNFTARGGKILWSRGIPREVRAFLYKNPEAGFYSGFKGVKEGGLEDGNNSDVVAYAKRLKPVVEKLLPDMSADMERALAHREATDMKAIEQIRAMPSAKGEERVLDCHSAYGPWPTDGGLAKVARLAKEWGFTALDVNVCAGPIAWYDSKVLHPDKEVAERGNSAKQLVAACRENGLKSVAWRCCFSFFQAGRFPEIADELERAGRCSVGRNLKPTRSFLCPVNPANRKMDVDAFVELAKMGVDVVEMDFIRYVGPDSCFCPICRKAFEEKIGAPVANWPDDVMQTSGDGVRSFDGKWTEFRVEAIASHIRDIRDAVKAVNPKVELWTTCFPYSTAIKFEGQDRGRWGRERLVDRIGFMNYTYTTAGFEGLVAAQRKDDYGDFTNIAPILGDVYWQGANTIAEKALVSAKQIEAARRQGCKTFTFFQLNLSTKPVLDILAQGPLKDK